MTTDFAHQLKVQKNVLKIAYTLPLENGEKISQLMNRAQVEVLKYTKEMVSKIILTQSSSWLPYGCRLLSNAITNPFTSWEHCYVYPVYNELGSNGELVLLPGIIEEEAQYQDFALSITLPAVFTFALIGIAYVLGTVDGSAIKRTDYLLQSIRTM